MRSSAAGEGICLILFTGAIWGNSQYPCCACESSKQGHRGCCPWILPRALLATAATHCRGTGWEQGPFKALGPSHFTCCKATEILPGVTVSFPLAGKHHPVEMFHPSLNPKPPSTSVLIQWNTYISLMTK